MSETREKYTSQPAPPPQTSYNVFCGTDGTAFQIVGTIETVTELIDYVKAHLRLIPETVTLTFKDGEQIHIKWNCLPFQTSALRPNVV